MELHGTTILCVRDNTTVAMGADGQMTQGECVLKSTTHKVKKIFNNKILAGFAGSVADALTLLNYFEKQMEKENDITKASLSLANQWRTNRIYRNLRADLLVADIEHTYLISGSGEVIEPEDNIIAIGSGSYYAIAAARGISRYATNIKPSKVVFESLNIAGDICIYTNKNITVEELIIEY